MHAALLFALYWGAAFLTLCLALLLLSLFSAAIDNDLELLTVKKEALIAGVASLIEGAYVWAMVFLVPGEFSLAAVRGLFIPGMLVVLIYTVAHFEDWNRWDAFLLVLFQVAVILVGAFLFAGHFAVVFLIMLLFGLVLALFAGFAKNT